MASLSACTAAALETGNRCSRERKLKSIRDPASREVRSEFDQPRPTLRLFSKAQAGYGALTLIKALAVSPAVPTTSVEAAKKTDISKAGRGKH